jgi:carboxylesterase
MPAAAWVAVALVGIGIVTWRWRHIRALEELTRIHRRLDSNGIVIGGEGFVLERAGGPAVLLLHGAGDTPQTLRYLAGALHANGFHVEAPLLPGHGRSLSDFARVSADAFTRAAFDVYDTMCRTHDWVAVIGLSMGGALAAQIAAERTNVRALGLVAPYLAMPPKIERAAKAASLWGWFLPVVRSADGVSIVDPLEREKGLAYGVFTPAALHALRVTMRRGFAALPRVSAPTIYIQSREDNRISPENAELAYSALGAHEKKIEWITGAGHLITVDFGRDRVMAWLVAWMTSHLRTSTHA